MRAMDWAIGFLGHVERCAVLLHLIDVTAEDPVAAYGSCARSSRPMRRSWPPSRRSSPSTRSTLIGEDELAEKIAAFKKRVRKTPLAISGATGQGVDVAMKKLLEIIQKTAQGRVPEVEGVTIEEDWKP